MIGDWKHVGHVDMTDLKGDASCRKIFMKGERKASETKRHAQHRRQMYELVVSVGQHKARTDTFKTKPSTSKVRR